MRFLATKVFSLQLLSLCWVTEIGEEDGGQGGEVLLVVDDPELAVVRAQQVHVVSYHAQVAHLELIRAN